MAPARQGAAAAVASHPGGEVWLFGSLARGDWDAYSDVDLLAIAPSQAAANALADDLLAARLGHPAGVSARCMAGEEFHAQSCYLAGQAAEQALKSLLVAAGITPPYSHSLERFVEMLNGQGLHTQALAELHLKPLTRMNSDSRYPQGDEAPADLFDANDSATALSTAEAVLRISTAELRS